MDIEILMWRSSHFMPYLTWACPDWRYVRHAMTRQDCAGVWETIRDLALAGF